MKAEGLIHCHQSNLGLQKSIILLKVQLAKLEVCSLLRCSNLAFSIWLQSFLDIIEKDLFQTHMKGLVSPSLNVNPSLQSFFFGSPFEMNAD